MVGKKGISALLVTVLIIGFAVVLAAVIFIWGGNFTKEMTEGADITVDEQMVCMKDVDYTITYACREGNTVKTTIENKGIVDIESLILRFYKGQQDVETNDTISGIPKLQVQTKEVYDVASPGSINQIDAVALVKLPGQLTPKPCEGKTEKYLDAQSSTIIPAC